MRNQRRGARFGPNLGRQAYQRLRDRMESLRRPTLVKAVPHRDRDKLRIEVERRRKRRRQLRAKWRRERGISQRGRQIGPIVRCSVLAAAPSNPETLRVARNRRRRRRQQIRRRFGR